MSSTLLEQARTMHEEMEVEARACHVDAMTACGTGWNEQDGEASGNRSEGPSLLPVSLTPVTSCPQRAEGVPPQVPQPLLRARYQRRHHAGGLARWRWRPSRSDAEADDPEILDKFSGEEMHGRFLDLNENHIQ
eukprot:498029-Hanusia_phi.AAC.2